MDPLEIPKAILDWNTVLHIDIQDAGDGRHDIVKLYPMEPGGPIELYLETGAAIDLAAEIALKSKPEE